MSLQLKKWGLSYGICNQCRSRSACASARHASNKQHRLFSGYIIVLFVQQLNWSFKPHFCNHSHIFIFQFVEFCSGHLTNSALIKLVYKRYNDCEEEFKSSEQFINLINTTTGKIKSGPDRIFVHLRDFLNELKNNKAEGCGTPKRTLDDSDNDQPASKKTKYLEINGNGENTKKQTDTSSKTGSQSDSDSEREPGEAYHADSSDSSNKITAINKTNDNNPVNDSDSPGNDLLMTAKPNDDQPMFIDSDIDEGQSDQERVSCIIDNLEDNNDKQGKSESPDANNHELFVEGGRIFVETDSSSRSNDCKLDPLKLVKSEVVESDVKDVKPIVNFVMQPIVKFHKLNKSGEHYENEVSKHNKSDSVIVIETDSDTDESDYCNIKCTCSKHTGSTKDTLSSFHSDCNRNSMGTVKQTKVIVNTSDSDHHKRSIKCPKGKSGETSGKNSKSDCRSHVSPCKLKSATDKLKTIAKKLIEEPVSVDVSDSTCNEQSDQDTAPSAIKSDKKTPKKRIELITENLFNKKMKEKLANNSSDGKSKQTEFSIERNGLDLDVEEQESESPKVIDKVKPSTSGSLPRTEHGSETRAKKGSQKQIKRLEDLLERIRDEIERVRERELDLEEMDDETSDYLLEDKLQKKFIKVWNKLCQLHESDTTTSRPTDKYFRYEGTRYPDVNNRIQKFVNRRRKVFPDYCDIRNIIMKVNRDKRLHLRASKIDDLAREAFTDVGNQLQHRRQQDFLDTFKSNKVDMCSVYDDPALFDPVLKKKLEANRKVAKSSLDMVLEKYVHLQDNIGDRYEEESDDDDDEDEDEDVENDAKQGAKEHHLLADNIDLSDNDIDNAQKCSSWEVSEVNSDVDQDVIFDGEDVGETAGRLSGETSDLVGSAAEGDEDLPVIELAYAQGSMPVFPNQPHHPGDITIASHNPGDITLASHSPGEISLVSNNPGDITLASHSPGEISLVSHHPGDTIAASNRPALLQVRDSNFTTMQDSVYNNRGSSLNYEATLLKINEMLYNSQECTSMAPVLSYEEGSSNGHPEHLNRKYCCHLCDKSYFRNSCLRRHLISHTGERFPCRVCSKTFTQANVRNTHEKNAHGRELHLGQAM